MNKLPLWLFGLMCTAAAAATGALMGPADVSTPAGRGEAFGQGVGRLAFFIVGVGLIIAHFIRRRDE